MNVVERDIFEYRAGADMSEYAARARGYVLYLKSVSVKNALETSCAVRRV